jgi:hypothetical protein
MTTTPRSLRFLIGATIGLGCNGSSPVASSHLRAPPDAIPEQVPIAAQSGTLGFALGKIRTPISIAPFRISKAPITVSDYAKCVAKGPCTPPSVKEGVCQSTVGADGATYSEDTASGDLAVTCVSPDQAKAYCDWVGGRLPTAAEWIVAARGPEVHRYSWGDTAPTCSQRARVSFFADFAGPCCQLSCTAPDTARVGRHSAGDSPSGMTDVLLTRGELIGPDQEDDQQGCPKGSPACIVHGIAPGAIDGLAPISTQIAHGFRCAWSGGGQ